MSKFPNKGAETLQIREEFSRRRTTKQKRKVLPFGLDLEIVDPFT